MNKTFAGLSLERPLVMGIVNVTPDSFSDGGDAFSFDDALARGLMLSAQGADIIDVGGESTRPGAKPVSIDEEISRTQAVVARLTASDIKVSIDTRHSGVMRAAIDAGASIVNDVTALEGDKRALEVVAKSDVSVVLMHMQGDPGTMQKNPVYKDAAKEVFEYLKKRVEICENAGIARERIAVDPGIGFGKNLEHNLQILKTLNMYQSLGLALLLGVSRKSFIGTISGEATAKDRLPGSLAAGIWGVNNGVNILRVHDVAETVQALKVFSAIESA
ncbi:MAG: dihydropteroate synthase [Rhodospirillaceae bacterium]|nr:dihydropteroate synthase [Rhodospirillaceae bacterium]